MDIEEVIDDLQYLISGDCTDNKMAYVAQIEVAVAALKKQIPKKLSRTRNVLVMLQHIIALVVTVCLTEQAWLLTVGIAVKNLIGVIMMSDIELKPCPFCGGKAEIIRVTEKYPNYVINCHKCRISTAWYADVKQLSEFWNKRADEKHGKWILEREPDGKPYCFHCSICDSDFRYIGIKTAFDFCPNCGAKMETEEYK